MKIEGPAQRVARPRAWMAAMAGLAMLATPMVSAQAAEQSNGLAVSSEWRNPKNTVHIRITPCGAERMCGTVIWASDKAKADAKRGGTDKLVGSNLFRDIRRTGPSTYKGRVFVPDMNRTFSGSMKLEGNAMVGRGCVLGVICKSQTWTRIS